MLVKCNNVIPSVNGVKIGYDPFFTGYSGFCFHSFGKTTIEFLPVAGIHLYYDSSYIKNKNNGTSAKIQGEGNEIEFSLNEFNTDWQFIWSEEDVQKSRSGTIAEGAWRRSAEFKYHFWPIDKIYSIDCFHMTKFPSYFYNITDFPSAANNIFRSESVSSIDHIDGDDPLSSHMSTYTNNIIPSITAVSAACPNLININGPFAHFTAAADYNEAKELYPEWTSPW